ncbi:MAG TPA: toll/interleukin-1 receptor domain-containing protein [Longimicrobium sp.]|jgi:hypothetical protein
MPSVTIQPASGPGAPSISGVRVFLSYSHEDSRLARKFVQYFELLAQSLRLNARDVLFFDERRLLPGYAWEDTLLESIAEADLVVFLVSANSLQAEHYCMRMEIARAAAAGIPIVPVVLTKCPWEGQGIPGDPRGRLLGDLGALPRNSKNHIKPVTHWERPDEAWDAVATGLRALLEKVSPAAAGGPPPSPAAEPDAGVVDIDLIPYLCDQRSAVRRFDAGLEAWDARALVVLVKGVYDDNPAQFWNRLRLENLAEFLDIDSLRGASLAPDRPLPLPAMDDEGESGAGLRRTLLHELSEALTGNRYRIKDVAALTAAMQGMDGVIALLAMPAARSAPALRATLEALLALIDEIPDEDVRRRTLVAVTLEDDALAARRLADEWDLHRFRGSLVVELDPLCAVTSQDARIWHVQHRIRDRFRLDEQRITGLFQKDDGLRLRHFESAFQRLLGHRGR